MLKIPLQAIVLSVLIHALWGGNPVGAKFGLMVFPPYWSAFIRFVFGIMTIWAWCQWRGIRILPTRNEWSPLLWISLLFTVQIGLMNMGFDQTTGVNGSILISTNPLFAAVFAHFLISSDSLKPVKLIGLLVGFAGVVITIVGSGAGSGPVELGASGDWLCLASACLLGFRLIASARAMKNLNPFRLAIWQMIFSLPLFAFAGGLFETIRWEALGWAPVLGLAYQGIVVAGVGFMASLWLISRYQASVMVSFNFISPVTGVLLSALLLGEALSSGVLLGVGLLAIGMILVCAGKIGKSSPET
ncbi:MAG: DMT family transporter [Granulosicoccus sp.]|nr:DMT family transporter [Granulosicoccus sp.]